MINNFRNKTNLKTFNEIFFLNLPYCSQFLTNLSSSVDTNYLHFEQNTNFLSQAGDKKEAYTIRVVRQ